MLARLSHRPRDASHRNRSRAVATWWALVLLTTTSALPSPSSAQAGGIALSRLERGLKTYELQDGTTLAHLKALCAHLREVTYAPEVKRGRYLRARVAADIALIAWVSNRPALLTQLAQVLEIDQADLVRFLRSEFDAAQQGTERSWQADRAVAALEATRAGVRPDSDAMRTAGRLRRGILLLGAIRRALDRGKAPLYGLETLADDPCAGPSLPCPALARPFDARGRRAVNALRQVGPALRRLRGQVQAGNPLAVGLSELPDQMHRALDELVLKPTLELPADYHLAEAPEGSTMVDADILVLVSETEARIGYLPTVRASDSLEPMLRAPGQPTLPATRAFAMPTEYRPYFHAISGLQSLLEEVLGGRDDVAIAVGPAVDVPAHVVARVLLSLPAATRSNVSLLARAADGSPKAIALQVLDKQQADELRPPSVKLRLRLGGYTVKVGMRDSMLIPAIKEEHGFRFDSEALLAGLQGHESPRSLEVSFMGGVAAKNLVSAMFDVVPQAEPTRLVVPH